MQEDKKNQSLENLAKRLMETHPALTKEEAMQLAKEAKTNPKGGKSTVKL